MRAGEKEAVTRDAEDAEMKLKVVVGFVVLVILAFTVFGDRGLVQLLSYKRQREALKEEARRLEEENRALAEEIERLKNDDSYLEQLAREELGMVKPGELVFQFTEAQDNGWSR